MVKKWIKQQGLRNKSIKDLQAQVRELKDALFTSRFQQSTGKLDNFRQMQASRRRLAAVLTIIREKELAGQAEEKK